MDRSGETTINSTNTSVLFEGEQHEAQAASQQQTVRTGDTHGVSSNRVLHDVLGTSTLARFDRDVLVQTVVKYSSCSKATLTSLLLR
jgi:hypothetical protein